MNQDLKIVVLEDWQTVSCNSCERHNHRGSTINTERFIDSKMYELQARNQTTVFCEDCLTLLQQTITGIKGV